MGWFIAETANTFYNTPSEKACNIYHQYMVSLRGPILPEAIPDFVEEIASGKVSSQ